MSEQEKTRRETLKLAAAVAAFGTALGFRQTAEASSGSTTPPGGPPTPPTTKTQIKMDRIYLKLYADGKQVMVSCSPLSADALQQLKIAGRMEHKFFLNNEMGWDVKANKKL
jgi:hypothetical protein